jgi:hypothetical protein
LFNNCYQDYGVRNARQLADLLSVAIGESGPEPFPESQSSATKDELYELAQQRAVPGRSAMSKDELRAALI